MPRLGCILQLRLHYETRGDTACGGASEGDLAIPKRGKEPPPANAALAAEPAQADRFLRARSARSASLLEDYTELIADLIAVNCEARTTDIARRMGVAHPTASKTIARLKREGLARARPYRGIFLTEAGAAMAKSARSGPSAHSDGDGSSCGGGSRNISKCRMSSPAMRCPASPS